MEGSCAPHGEWGLGCESEDRGGTLLEVMVHLQSTGISQSHSGAVDD